MSYNYKNLLATLGLRLLEKGYNIVAIAKGSKRPVLDNWTNLEATEPRVQRWAKEFPGANVGIQTRYTPAIDIDVLDKDLAEEIETWCLENLGDAPIRIGRAPKRLLLFRTDKPFTKQQIKLTDPDGQKHKIEILGDGQQFVAFGIHPDTGKPFEWASIENPEDLYVDDLPTLNVEDAIRALDACAKMARKRGWSVGNVGSSSRALTVVEDDDDALFNAKGKLDDLTDEDIADALKHVPDPDDYDRWIEIGMALHHQYDGDERGLKFWHDWSSQADNYDPDVLETKWESFNDVRTHGKAVTFATVLLRAKDGLKQQRKDEFERAKNIISTCNDVDDLFSDVAAKVAQVIIHEHQIEAVAKMIQDRAYELDNVKRSISIARKAVTRHYTKRKANPDENMPEWAQGWVWLESADRFYHLEEHAELTIQSFNARYDLNMLTDEEKKLGVAIPAQRASAAALNLYDIPKVRRTAYLPGAGPLVTLDGDLCVNIYNNNSMPETREPKTAEEKRALRAVTRHFETILPDERERSILISFLAYQVQNPSGRVNWAVLLQGVEGAGKSWIRTLMGCVLGPKNVGPVSAKLLFAEFNGWAEGKKMVFIEEIRLHGHNRHEVLDGIKEVITNSEIPIRRMHRDAYNIPNVTSYMLFTNYQDALPASRNDRRYFVVQTFFQSVEQIETFLTNNPGYFDNLFEAVTEHPEVMHWWLKNWTMHPEFKPDGRAPSTIAKRRMIQLAGSDEVDAINDIVEEGVSPRCSAYVMDTLELATLLEERNVYGLKTRALQTALQQAGFTFLGRIKINGVPRRIYTRSTELFGDSEPDTAKRVRDIWNGDIEPGFL